MRLFLLSMLTVVLMSWSVTSYISRIEAQKEKVLLNRVVDTREFTEK